MEPGHLLGPPKPDQPDRAYRRRRRVEGGKDRYARAGVYRDPPPLVHRKGVHHTHGGVNVLNLVEGREAIVESPDEAFEPFVIHYAETFIVPAAVGPYTILLVWGKSRKECDDQGLRADVAAGFDI